MERAGEIKGELLAIFGELSSGFTPDFLNLINAIPFLGHLDNHIPLDGRTKIRNALNAAGVQHTWIEFAHVQHAYIRDELSKGRYDSAAARVTFELMFDLFQVSFWGRSWGFSEGDC